MTSDEAHLEAKPPIFVVGYMHSGTTLLLELLGGHPEIFAPKHETKFFVHLDQTRHRFPLDSAEDLDAFTSFCRYVVEHGFPIGVEGQPWRTYEPVDIGAVSRDHGEVFAAVMSGYGRRAGTRRWLEKTPTHIFHVDDIVRSVAAPYFVEIVRDPRDVLASKKTRRKTVWTTERHPVALRPRKHLEKAFDPLWDGLSWRAAVHAGERAQEALPDRWVRVRYEDLVADPRRVVGSICEVVDLDAGSVDFDVTRGVPADVATKQRDERGIAITSIGRFRTILEPGELATCQLVGGSAMLRLGYRVEPVRLGLLRVAWQIVFRSAPELAVRSARRFKLGGTRYGWDVLKGYFHRAKSLLRRGAV